MNAVFVELEGRSRLLRAPSWMPVSSPQWAAVWRERGAAASLLEPRASGDDAGAPARLAESLRGRPPDAVIFDVRMEWWGLFRRCARAAREAAPRARLLAGGRLATMRAADVLRFVPELDAVLIGEAEPALARIAEGAALRDLAGVLARDGSEAPRENPVADLDALPPPAWDLLDMRYYTRRTPRVIPCLPLRTATLQTSRGCAAACAFCAEGRANARRHRFHDPDYVIAAAERLAREYGVEAFYFSDANFAADRGRVLRFCEAWRRRGLARLRWSAQARADTLDAELLAALRSAGCVQLELGIESGSERLLRAQGKGLTVERTREAIRRARAAGIRVLAYVMAGIPGETREDLEATRRFLAETNPAIVRLNPFLFYPGAPATERLIAAGRLPADFWRDAETSLSALDGPEWNMTDIPFAELRNRVRGLEREAVLSRFARDFLAHQPPWAAVRHFRVGALPGWLRRKLRP